jgi:hypothetical protein
VVVFCDLATAQFFGKCTQECVRDFVAHLKNQNATEFLRRQNNTCTHFNLTTFKLRRKSQNDETPKTLTSQQLIFGMKSLTIWSSAFCIPESVREAEPRRFGVLLQYVHADAVGLPAVADRRRPRAV